MDSLSLLGSFALSRARRCSHLVRVRVRARVRARGRVRVRVRVGAEG